LLLVTLFLPLDVSNDFSSFGSECIWMTPYYLLMKDVFEFSSFSVLRKYPTEIFLSTGFAEVRSVVDFFTGLLP
jgi:hypothetical protein